MEPILQAYFTKQPEYEIGWVTILENVDFNVCPLLKKASTGSAGLGFGVDG